MITTVIKLTAEETLERIARADTFINREVGSSELDPIVPGMVIIGRILWRLLFAEVESEQQLEEWEKKIPRYECDCKKFYSDWKASNPPTFPLSFRWKYDLKAAVNAKLGHANLTIDDAIEFWSKQTTDRQGS